VRSERRQSGFTLLEVMVTLAVIAISVFKILELREKSINTSIDARNENLARMLAREILTELEFHDIENRGGPIDEYPGFAFTLDVEEIDLVTGEGDPEAEKREQEKQRKREGEDSSSRFAPTDAQDNSDELQELVYPVRKVKLTLRYPNLREDSKEPNQLVVETVLPPLPESIEEHNRKMSSEFQNERSK
jgi:prepilin-type N-terminal cleavage/methylation domain-containing protein